MLPKALTIDEIKAATREDDTFKKLVQHIQDGTGKFLRKDPQLETYYRVFPELSVIDDVIMRGIQIVIPTNLQSRVIDICHEGHLGIVKSKQLLRSKTWFPNIDKKMESKCKDVFRVKQQPVGCKEHHSR